MREAGRVAETQNGDELNQAGSPLPVFHRKRAKAGGRLQATVWSTAVQTTLLSFGIAVILALLAALIGPLFIDWGEYRAVIESQASQMVGAPVRVGGAIDVRLLPTPSLKLGYVQIGPAASAEKVTARGLAMEFGLGALMQGEFRASQVALDRPEMRVGLDRSGVVQIPRLNIRFNPDRLSLERLTIHQGHLLLAPAPRGPQLAITPPNLPA